MGAGKALHRTTLGRPGGACNVWLAAALRIRESQPPNTEETVRRTLAVAALTAVLAVPASAQIAWEAPALIGPAAPAGVSVFLIDADFGGLGGLVTFRHDAGPVGLGYRFALADQGGADGGVAVAGGVDISGYLATAVEGSEVDLVWWAGGGVGIGNETVATIPVGLALGWTGSGGTVRFSPYGGGHVALSVASGPGDNVDLGGVVDLGIDLEFDSGWLVRFGVAVGDREAIAIGARLPT